MSRSVGRGFGFDLLPRWSWNGPRAPLGPYRAAAADGMLRGLGFGLDLVAMTFTCCLQTATAYHERRYLARFCFIAALMVLCLSLPPCLAVAPSLRPAPSSSRRKCAGSAKICVGLSFSSSNSFSSLVNRSNASLKRALRTSSFKLSTRSGCRQNRMLRYAANGPCLILPSPQRRSHSRPARGAAR